MANTQKQNVQYAKELKNLVSDVDKLYQSIDDTLKDTGKTYQSLVDKSKKISDIAKEESKQKKVDISVLQEIKKIQEENLEIAEKKKEQYDMATEAARKQIQPLEDIRDKIKNVGNTIMGFVLSPWLAVGAALVGIGALFAKIEKAGEGFRQQTGITGDNFQRIRDVAEQTSVNFAKFGVDAEKAYEITKALSDEFGTSDRITSDLAGTVATMNVALGMSADESAKVVSNIMSMLGGSEEMATNLIKGAAALSRQARVAPSAVISDISENSEAIAKYTDETGDNIARAAVMARTLGVNIGTVATIADNLLDFETSIENQMNAMVLTGRSINLERARALALEGDLAELQKELVKNLASENEWNRMNMIERQAYAQSLGISVAEMGKMISRQKDLRDLTEGTIGPIDAMRRGASLADILEAEKVLSPLTELGNTLTRIVSILVRALNPAFKVLNYFLSLITKGMDAFSGGILSALGGVGKMIVAVIGLAVSFRILRFAISRVGGALGKLFGLTGGAKTGMFSGLFGGLSFGAIAKGALLMGVVAGSLFLLGKAVQQFANVEWKDLGMAGAALAGLIGAVAALGLLMMSGIGTVAILAGAGAMAIMAGSLYVLGKALQEIKMGLEGFSEKIVAIAQSGKELFVAAGAIYALSGALVSMSAALATSSLANFFGLGGGGMIDKLIELSNNAQNLKLVADSVQTIAGGGVGAGIAPAAVGAAAVGGMTNVTVSSPTEEESPVVEKIDELISLLKNGVGLNLTPAGGTKLGEVIAANARK